MDFRFSEEQQAAVEAARAVFGGVAPDTVPSPVARRRVPSRTTSTGPCGRGSPTRIC